MLAGYLPFDDDPANPEGDNISLLYKYIVSTPLTFPEYVTPHARDLLKRILVPDPRKRADLFEVARHSWLADYSHVVGFITSGNTNATDAQPASVYASEFLPTANMQRHILITHSQTRSSNHLHSLEAPPFANPQSHIQRPLLRTADSLPNANKSPSHPRRSPRRSARPSVEPFRSSTLRLRRKPHVAKHHHRPKRRRKHAARRSRCHPRTVTSRLRAPSLLAFLVHLKPGDRSLSDQYPTTRHLAMLPHLLLGLPQVVLWVPRDCHHEETRTASLPWPPLLRQMPKVASRSRRASSTRFLHLMPRRRLPILQSLRTLASQATSEFNRYNLGHRAQRAAIGGPTLLLRLWDV
jgi:serine/threonine protein kinase